MCARARTHTHTRARHHSHPPMSQSPATLSPEGKSHPAALLRRALQSRQGPDESRGQMHDRPDERANPAMMPQCNGIVNKKQTCIQATPIIARGPPASSVTFRRRARSPATFQERMLVVSALSGTRFLMSVEYTRGAPGLLDSAASVVVEVMLRLLFATLLPRVGGGGRDALFVTAADFCDVGPSGDGLQEEHPEGVRGGGGGGQSLSISLKETLLSR